MKRLNVTVPEPVRQRWQLLVSAYEARAPREQLALRWLGIVILLLLAWALIWQPVWQWRDDASRRYASQGKMLAWIQANEPVLRASGRDRRSGGQDSGGDWSSAVSKSLGRAGLTMKSMTPEGQDAVRIQLEDQPFPAVAAWLSSVNQQLGAAVGSAEITPGGGSGLINLRATLRRGG